MNTPAQSVLDLIQPITRLSEIIPSDSADLSPHCRGIYVGDTGDVRITSTDGDTVTLVSLSAGQFHPVCASRVWASGTTATDIVAAL